MEVASKFTVSKTKFIDFPELENIKVIEFKVSNHNLFSRLLWLNVRLPLICLSKRIDLLHRIIAELPLIRMCKYVITLHDFMFDFYIQNQKLRKYLSIKDLAKFLFLKNLNQHAFIKSSSIIVFTETLKEEFTKKYKLLKSKVQVVYAASEEKDLFRTEKKVISPYSFGMVAGFYPHKGHLRVLKLASYFIQLNFVDFKIYFRGSHVYKNLVTEVKKEIKKLGLDNYVTFEAYDPKASLSDIYSKYDAVLLISEYEGFGFPVLEAQSHSSVVICSDIPVFKEILGDSALYMNLNFTKNEAQNLLITLSDTQKLAQLKKAGIINVHSYSWPRMAKKTMELYHQFLN
ncbi:MAG: glycosyltransferase [Chitinophagaceae bacterium]